MESRRWKGSFRQGTANNAQVVNFGDTLSPQKNKKHHNFTIFAPTKKLSTTPSRFKPCVVSCIQLLNISCDTQHSQAPT